MKLAVAKLQIDRQHSRKLLDGKPIIIKVPAGCDAIRLQLDLPQRDDSFAKVCDVVFNGRPA